MAVPLAVIANAARCIHSRAVPTLTSTRGCRIIDAVRDGIGTEADVTGVNITLTAGDNEITGTSADRSGQGGIGTPDGEVLRIRDERGRLDYIRDDQGNPVKSRLNEDLLQKIARATKGFYLPLRGGKTALPCHRYRVAERPASCRKTLAAQQMPVSARHGAPMRVPRLC